MHRHTRPKATPTRARQSTSAHLAPLVSSLFLTFALVFAACDSGSSEPGPSTLSAPLEGDANDPFLVTAPTTRSGTLAATTSHHFRLTVPPSHSGLRIAASCSTNCSLYLRRTSPTAAITLQSTTATLHTFFRTPAETTADDLWFIEVRAGTAAGTYNIAFDPRQTIPIAWDPGTSLAGTTTVDAPDLVGGDYLFQLPAQLATFGAWRSVLTVPSGEAGLYMGSGTTLPALTTSYRSERVGSDAVLLASNEFTANQTWTLRVRAQPQTPWRLLTGDIVVTELGVVTDDTTPRNLAVGPERVAWVRASIPNDALAWRLSSPAGTTLYVNDNAAPIPGKTATWDLTRPSQLLVVPDYLTAAQYLVGIQADAATVSLVSAKQTILTPSTQPNHQGNDFDFVLSGQDTGFSYLTYRVDVPVDQIAFEVTATPLSGDVDVYVRRGKVPTEYDNSGMSEVMGITADSVIQVPPTLTDGPWYITVRGTPPFSFELTSGNPEITDIAYINDPNAVINAAPLSGRSGWRYFRVLDIPSQTGTLGWLLDLENQVPGSELAVRRNGVPGRWYYRQNRETNTRNGSHLDASSTNGFLERPNHAPDVWYIGVFQRDAALGEFGLRTRQLTPTDLDFNTGDIQVTAQPSGRFRWFKTTVPASALGLDLGLFDVSSGSPRMVIRQDLVPSVINSTPFSSSASNNWASGDQWAPTTDLSNRPYRPFVQGQNAIDESGRRVQMGLGTPLTPSVYYIGVSDTYTTPTGIPMTYRIRARGIGQGNAPSGAPWTIQVADLAFDGGSATITDLPAREVAWFRTTLPAGSDSFALELDPTSGEAAMALLMNRLPNSDASTSYTFDGAGPGTRRQKVGREFFYRYPTANQTTITSGPVYVGVISEGQSPNATSYIGTGTSSFTLTSLGGQRVITAPPLTADAPLEFTAQALHFGQQRAYRFEVPTGFSSMELRLKNTTGRPYLNLVGPPNLFPNPSESYTATQGGAGSIGNADPNQVITITDPMGVYTALVTATNLSNQQVGATFDLEIVARGEGVIDFNGGVVEVEGQSPQTWRFFKVVVPEGALGWDLRLLNVQSGTPKITIRRDDLPASQATTCCYVYNRSTWGTGDLWSAASDITNRPYGPYVQGQPTRDESGRYIQMGIGSPLVPGTYYVGIIDSTSSSTGLPMSYALVSRGIGQGDDADGQPWEVQVVDIEVDDEVVVTDLPAREVAYYRVTTPAGLSSFEAELVPTAGEAMLAINEAALPNSSASGAATSINSGNRQGARRQKTGREHFYVYPPSSQTTLAATTYYFAVAAEGVAPFSTSYLGTGASSFVFSTKGQIEVDVAAAPLSTASPTTWSAQTVPYGAHKTYELTVPAGTISMEVRLTNTTGRPYLSMSRTSPFPNPTESYSASQGGWGSTHQTESIATIPSPAGTWRITVTATNVGGATPEAGYDLAFNALSEEVIAFNGGSIDVTLQPTRTWRYFRVTVPPDPLGWDLRLEAVTGGAPKFVVQRDTLPSQLTTSCCYIYDRTTWATGEPWHPSYDFTNRPYAPYVQGQASVTEADGRHLVAGMNAPLSPGQYIIGVIDSTTTNGQPMTYRLTSKGIGQGNDGEGAPWQIQVVDVPWLPAEGSVEPSSLLIEDLPARSTVYARVVVPADVEALGFELETLVGESTMAVKKNALPNMAATESADANQSTSGRAARRQKAGDEFYYQYVASGQTALTAGTWYFALTSEGQNPFSSSYIGTGTSSFRFKSLGRLLPEGGITRIVSPGETVRFEDQTLRYGEHRLYRFRVTDDVPAYELRLAERVGNPQLSLQVSPFFSTAIPSPSSQSYTASSGGQSQLGTDGVALNMVNRSGDITVVVWANRDVNIERDASFDLVVTPRTVTPIAWRGGTAELTLGTKENRYFELDVPNDCDGVPLAGWLITAENTTGTYTLRARKDSLPGSPSGSATFQAAESQVVVSPPFFTPGKWYLSVESTNLSTLTIRSEEITELQSWRMPLRGVNATTPGLTHPMFADSGVAATGQPINAGDRGRDLGQGRHHFYRVTVPPGNGGLMATYLEALSGNPDLYIRRGAAPSRNHSSNGNSGSLYDYDDVLANTTYGHLVTGNTRNGYELAPGEWWIAVYAPNSNVRYRLQLTVGDIQPLAFEGGLVNDASLAAGDMRHYRVSIPEASPTLSESTPTSWSVRLLQEQGDAIVFLRELVPSGQTTSNTTPSQVTSGTSSNWSDWVDDRSNVWGAGAMPSPVVNDSGTAVVNVPALSPGSDYIISVYAKTQTVYDLESIPGPNRLAIDGVIDFEDGQIDVVLAPNERRTWRIDTPVDAARWLQDATVGTSVWMYLSLGTPPPLSSSADRTNSGSSASGNVDWSIPLYSNNSNQFNWPWMPDRSYYLTIENRNTTAQPFALAMDGRLRDDDSDTDGLPDWWEFSFFGSLATTATADSDSDGLSTLEEYLLGTRPNNADSDGDGLYDGLEVLLEADPTDADSDGDQSCDGDDSAPTDPNEAGEVIRLIMSRYTEGEYGAGFGSSRHTTRLRAVMAKTNGARAHWVHMKAFDIEAGELEIFVNGVKVGDVPATPASDFGLPTMFWVETNDLRTGDNFVELRRTANSDGVWGVADLGLFTFGDRFGADATRAYDTRHPEGFRLIWPKPVAMLLELQGFDIEADADTSEIEAFFGPLGSDLSDAEPWLRMPASSDLMWSGYFQVPIGAIDLSASGQAPFGARVLEVRRNGGDGTHQLRLVEMRTTLTSTFGTSGVGTENSHARTTVGMLFPTTPGDRLMKLRYQAWPAGSGAAIEGTNTYAYPAVLPASQNLVPAAQEVLLCSLADVIDVARMTWVAPPTGTPTWNVAVTYYGVPLDSDNDGRNDCIDRFPRDVTEWFDDDRDRLGDNWERRYFDELTVTDGTADTDGDGTSDRDEYVAVTDPVCADVDGDEAVGRTVYCTTGTDCDDTNPNIGSAAGDADCDTVPVELDCDDEDPLVTQTNVGDADCDGVATAIDCNDADATVTTTRESDGDCDGVPSGVDCDDTNPTETGSIVGDADCDGVPTGVDCDDADAGVTASNVGDADCDGVPTGVDCDDGNAAVTTSSVGDLDCDGVATGVDCDDGNAAVTSSNVGDADCDGVPTADDCDDGNPLLSGSVDANDRDCDGVPTPIDCNDADRTDVRTRVDDADCDGVGKSVDCDDQDASDTRTRDGDFDCDGVATGVDCNDADASDTRSNANDADCDGAATGEDCDDNDPTIQACPVCVDVDEDGRFAIGAGCPAGDDCDDGDRESTTRDVDADCDGTVTDLDCDDEDSDSTLVESDADCDGVATELDCDDADGLVGARAEDADCDGVPDTDDNCPALANSDQLDTDLDGVGDACEECIGEDADGDFVPDACDVCPTVEDDQADADDDGIGDACEDGDGDGVYDRVDNCPAVPNADQSDTNRNGVGDLCDTTVVSEAESAGCAGGRAFPWLFGVLALVWFVRRRSVQAR